MSSIGSALANVVTFGGYGANKAAKQQAAAAKAMADAVAEQKDKPEITSETKDVSVGEDLVQGKQRRRMSLSSTANGSPLSSLSERRRTLG